MSVDVSRFDDDRETWDRYVNQSPQGSIFHRYDVIEIFENLSGGEFHLLIGHKGQEPVGLFPVLELRKLGMSMTFSPPPRMGIPYQGPIHLNVTKLKQRKRERRMEQFVEGCLEWCERELEPRYTHVRTQTRYEDPRPFMWNEFSTNPRYTYHLDISRDPDEVKTSFSKSLRRYLDPDENRFEIELQGADGIRFVHQQMTARYNEQGLNYVVPLDLLLDLYSNLPEDAVRPYICLVDGEREGGIVVLRDSDTVYFQEGGGAPDVDYPINDLLHWRIIEDAHDVGLSRYDLAGANDPRLCSYKSKFNPELTQYFTFEKGTPLMNMAVSAYKKIRM